MRIALGIEYDGATFTGWQTQTGGRGVQDAVESALAQIAGSAICNHLRRPNRQRRSRARSGRPLRYRCHSAIDGLGARRQPVSCRRQWRFSGRDRWARDFHARYGARRRRYDYWILNAPVRSPLAHARAGWVFRPLDENDNACRRRRTWLAAMTSRRSARRSARRPRRCDRLKSCALSEADLWFALASPRMHSCITWCATS